MSHRAVIAIVDGTRAKVVSDRWAGARVIDLLHAPVDAVDLWTDDQRQLGELAASPGWEAAILVDRSRRRVLWFGSPLTGYIGEAQEPPSTLDEWRAGIDTSWNAFSIEEVDGVEPMVGYLARHRVEVEPPELDGSDLGEIVRAMVPEPPDLDARRELLEAADRDAPRRPPSNERRASMWWLLWWLLPGFAVLLVPALLARLVLFRFRPALRRRLRRRLDRERAKQVEAIRTLHERVQADPNDHAARIDRALGFDAFGQCALAERELDTVVAATSSPDPLHALALHNRGVIRAAMRLEALAEADFAAARDAGYRAPKPGIGTAIRTRLMFLGFGFRLVAGIPIDADDD